MSVTTATATELWRLSATDLAQAIRSKQISSREVIEAHLRRIEAVNPAVNAVTVVLGEQALEAAKAADRVVAAGGKLPLLHSVPFTVKENMDLVGTPTTMGVRALADAYPTLDAPTVERMRAAGAIPIGGGGLPQAVQVIGPRYREDLCLAAAAALEDRVGAITPIDPR